MMSPCKLVSVTAVHRHVVVDVDALVVNPLQKQQQQHKAQSGVAVFFRVAHLGPSVVDMSGVEHAHGAAWRRRQRRLRQHWRRVQLTLQMVLATVEHHSGPGLRSASCTPRHGARSLLSPPARSSSPWWTRTVTSGQHDRAAGTARAVSAAHRGAWADLLVVPVLQMVDQLAEVVVDVPIFVSRSEFQLRTVEHFVNILIPDSGISPRTEFFRYCGADRRHFSFSLCFWNC